MPIEGSFRRVLLTRVAVLSEIDGNLTANASRGPHDKGDSLVKRHLPGRPVKVPSSIPLIQSYDALGSEKQSED
jgi:hypothetical protein